MKNALILAVGLGIWAGVPAAGHAEWGWPPPGYSTTGVRACDGHVYRGLCAKWRERKAQKRAAAAAECATPAVPDQPPVSPAAPQKDRTP